MKERVTEYTCCPKCGLPFLTETDEQIAKRLIEEWYMESNTLLEMPNVDVRNALIDWLDGRDDD